MNRQATRRIVSILALCSGVLAAAPFVPAAQAGNVAWGVSVGGPGFGVSAGQPGFVGAPFRPVLRPAFRPIFRPVFWSAPRAVVVTSPWVFAPPPVVFAPRRVAFVPRPVFVPTWRPSPFVGSSY